LDLPDPDDEAFLAVALAASADYLVTGNLAHYPHGKRKGCAVLSPAEFMNIWLKLKGKS
jgi:predicted nucleic acid-binding protein